MSSARGIFVPGTVMVRYEDVMTALGDVGLREGDELVGETFARCVLGARKGIHTGLDAPMQNALNMFHGLRLDRDLLADIAWRAAAGYKRIKQQLPLEDMFTPVETREVALLVENVWPGRPSASGKPQLKLQLRVASGLFGGLSFSQMMPSVYVLRVLAKRMGLPQYKRALPREIVGMFFLATLSTENGRPRVLEARLTDGLKRYNKELHAFRAEPCTWGYKWACRSCPAGSNERIDNCSRAPHPRAYVDKTCPRCKRRQWYDPQHESAICLRCEFRSRGL